jgi:O-antigen ligase
MKNLTKENLLLICWLSILFSINSIYINTISLQEITIFSPFSKKNIFLLLNNVRFYSPFLVLPILTAIFFLTRVKKNNIMVSLFLFYFAWQLFAFFVTDYLTVSIFSTEKELLFDNLHLIFCSISVLLIVAIGQNLNLKKFNKKILFISLFFIGLVAIYFAFNMMIESMNNDSKFIYWSETLNPSKNTFGQPNPRVTGVSRLLLILYFLVFCFFINNHKKIILHLILIILFLILYKMQARGALLGIPLLFCLFFIFNPLALKKKLLIFFTLIVIPIFIFEAYYSVKKNMNSTDFELNQENWDNNNRVLTNHSSSGRLSIWNNVFDIIKNKKIILGFGPQADRLLLNEFLMQYDKSKIYKQENGRMVIFENNTSNALLYSYLCGGLLGLLLLVAIYFFAIKTVIKNIFITKIFQQKNTIQAFSTILLIYLGLRSVFENSFSLFSVDYIFFILSYTMAENKKELDL